MKYTKLLSLSLVLFTLLGCNQSPSANQVVNPIEEETASQEENSNSSTDTNSQAAQASQTRNNSPQITTRVETTSQTRSNSPQRTTRVEKVTPKQNTSPQIVAQKQTSSKYATIEELKELDEKIRKRNGRIIGSATCDNDGIENDYRVDFDGDGMPDECVTANARMHPLILQDDINFVRDTVNSLEKGSQVTSKEQGSLTYYLWKKNGEIVKAIKSENGSATSVQYWFYLGKPFAVQRIDDSSRSTVKNTIFIYDKNANLYSVYEVFGGEGDNSKHITDFNNQQLQEAAKLFNGYQEIFNVFGAD